MTNKLLIKSLCSFLVLGAVVSTFADTLDPHGPWFNKPNGGSPLAVGNVLIASGGDVTVTFLGPTGAGFDEHLFVAAPPNGFGMFFDDHSTPNGATVDLGTYAAGTEIIFGLYVDSTGNTFYDGPGSRNADGFVHAYLVSNYEGLADTTYVGFEDIDGRANSDWNYIDEVFAFTGTRAAETVPDASASLSLLGMGLFGLAVLRRRFGK